MSEEYQFGGRFQTFKQPVYTWKCEIFGISMMREEGQQPNWFWRLTQRAVLGMKWSRVK